MKGKAEVQRAQKEWAINNGIVTHHLNENYAKQKVDNLFRSQLTSKAKKEFNEADGSELKDGKTRPAKIKAFYSSSALAYNVFEYWREKNKTVLASALELADNSISTLRLEEILKTGISKPNIDVFLNTENGASVAIESKFCEWMNKSNKTLKDKYFFNGTEPIKRWEDVGLVNSQSIAERVKNDDLKFNRLDAPQLLKHALGIGVDLSKKTSLLYIYFDLENSDSKIGREHRNEVEKFKELMDGELNFRAITYQQMFRYMKQNDSDIDKEYLSYLEERYFSI